MAMSIASRVVSALLLAWVLIPDTPSAAATPPPAELVNVYHGHAHLADFWVSEKYNQ